MINDELTEEQKEYITKIVKLSIASLLKPLAYNFAYDVLVGFNRGSSVTTTMIVTGGKFYIYAFLPYSGFGFSSYVRDTIMVNRCYMAEIAVLARTINTCFMESEIAGGEDE